MPALHHSTTEATRDAQVLEVRLVLEQNILWEQIWSDPCQDLWPIALFSDDLDLTWGVQNLTEEHKVLKVVWTCFLCQRQEC